MHSGMNEANFSHPMFKHCFKQQLKCLVNIFFLNSILPRPTQMPLETEKYQVFSITSKDQCVSSSNQGKHQFKLSKHLLIIREVLGLMLFS